MSGAMTRFMHIPSTAMPESRLKPLTIPKVSHCELMICHAILIPFLMGDVQVSQVATRVCHEYCYTELPSAMKELGGIKPDKSVRYLCGTDL